MVTEVRAEGEILLAQPRGFCAGVDRAITIVQKALEKFGAPIYVRHEIVHNAYVVNDLRAKGAIFVDELSEVPAGATVIFSAHGVSKQVQAEAKERGLQVFDATCPLVTKVHIEVHHHASQGREIVFIGHAGHPEVEGTMGQYDNPEGGIYLVESPEDVASLEVKNPLNLAWVTQTTLSIDDTQAVVAALKVKFPEICGPKKDDICYATQNRQDAVKKLADTCDLILVVGSPNSSNSNRLREIAEKLGFRATTDDRFKILEVNVDLDLKGYEHEEDGEKTGIAIPYIVTLEKGTAKVLAIRRNWRPEDPTYRKREHFVHYPYIPGFGFYAFGLIHMIGAFAKSGTSLLRQLVDAGSLANLPGGFKTRGLRVKGDDTPIAPGEFRDVDVPGGTIKDNLLPLPYKEPSQTLYQLLNQIIEDGRRFANTADLQVTDMSSQAPVGTTLAILERTLKVMSAVQARIHFAMKEELGLLKEIIRDYTPDDYDYVPEEGRPQAKKSDYDQVDVIPVSDPNASTMAQKIVQYQAVLQLAQTAPQMYNMPLLHRQMLDVLGIKDAQKLVPMEEDQKPTDPITENQNILMGKPVKAFQYQDHKAHITVHTSAMQDPMLQQLMQKDPAAQQKAAAAQAHINEHLGFEYRVMIEQALGMVLPPQKDESGEDVPMDPEVEAQLAPLLAQAAQQVLAQNQQQVAQQQAQQAAQDPVVQLQQQELAIKQADQQRKAAKDQADLQLKQRQQDIEVQRNQMQLAASQQRDQMELQKEMIIHNSKQHYDRDYQSKEIMADALKTALQIKTSKGD